MSKVERSLSSIEEKLADLLSKRNAENRLGHEISLKQNGRKLLEKIPSFLESIGRGSYPTLVLGAFPSEEITVNEIYDGGSMVSAAFDKSPELRQNGFGLNSYSQSELIGGVARRVVSGIRKGRELSNSGRLLVGVAADDDFLGWAMNRRKGYPLKYRSFVLAEVTYIFAAYVRQIFDAIGHKPRHLDILVALRNSFIDDLPPQLGIAADHSQFHHDWIEPKSAPKENVLKSVRVPIDITVERLDFETRACLYRRFGFGDDLIPYATLTAEGRTTTAQHILDPNLR